MSARERKDKRERIERENKREVLFKLIAEKVESLGYECVHVGLNNTSGLSIQVLIDLLGGINLKDCERVSKAVNLMLDKLDEEGSEYLAGLRDRYYLEVSSPGIERPLFSLEHYKRFEGREAKIKLAEPLDGRKNLTGKIILADIENKIIKIYIKDEEREMDVPFNIIKAGNLKEEGLC